MFLNHGTILDDPVPTNVHFSSAMVLFLTTLFEPTCMFLNHGTIFGDPVFD